MSKTYTILGISNCTASPGMCLRIDLDPALSRTVVKEHVRVGFGERECGIITFSGSYIWVKVPQESSPGDRLLLTIRVRLSSGLWKAGPPYEGFTVGPRG